ncbi:MAG: S41 family peptidase [Acidobacteriota bacterium]|nr:S41 family peptidase [Acidobacteriota bacterium]
MQGAERWRRAAWLAVLGLAVATAVEAQPTDRPAGPAASLNVETFDFAWRRIADTFWDESMGGVDWQKVADELRPRARDAADNAELRLVLQDMLSRLGQSHFGVLPGRGAVESPLPVDDSEETGGCTRALIRAVAGAGGSAASDAGPGFDVRFIDSTPVVSRVEPGSSADRQGIRMGLEVVRVENQNLAALEGCLGLESLDPWVAKMVRLRAVEGLLYGDAGDPVGVEFADRAGDQSMFELERTHHPDAVELGFGNLPKMRYLFATDVLETAAGRVLVVRFNVWLLPVIRAVEAALYGESAEGAPAVDGVLIDLRGNPGGVAGTAVGVAGYLLEERVVLGRMKNRNTELNLVVYPRQISSAGKKIEGFAGPVAVLIDGGSASTSEIFAAGLQDHGRARLFGAPSAAAALPSVIEGMPNGDLLMHAIADFERPSGERVEGRPVVPESPVSLTREGLLAGRDEPRDAALAWIVSELERDGG